VVDVLLYVTHETAKSKSPLALMPANQVRNGFDTLS
jgi:hypothetical protein